MGSGAGFRMRNLTVCTVPPNIVRVIKSRILTWRGHVARTEEGRSTLINYVTSSAGLVSC